MAYMYILRLANQRYYVGCTYNLTKRVREHHSGQVCYTKRFLPAELVYFEEYETKEEAAKRERQLKGWSRSKKEKLIKGEWGKPHCVYPECVEGTNEELVLNMLAELSTTSIPKAKDPQTLEDNMQCAADGGHVARVAREELEAKTGKSVVSPLSAKRFFENQRSQELEGKESKDPE